MHSLGFWLAAVFVLVGFVIAFAAFYRLSALVNQSRPLRVVAAALSSLLGMPLGFFVGGNLGFFVGSGPLQQIGVPPILGVPGMMVVCIAALTILSGIPIMLLWRGSSSLARRIKAGA
jgi:hypothetical protein